MAERVDRGFHGELVEYYHRYRHGYPGAVTDALAELFGLSDRDVAVDLGCGTGQLTLALAGQVRAVLGIDPEPDMLRRAQQAATGRPHERELDARRRHQCARAGPAAGC